MVSLSRYIKQVDVRALPNFMKKLFIKKASYTMADRRKFKIDTRVCNVCIEHFFPYLALARLYPVHSFLLSITIQFCEIATFPPIYSNFLFATT